MKKFDNHTPTIETKLANGRGQRLPITFATPPGACNSPLHHGCYAVFSQVHTAQYYLQLMLFNTLDLHFEGSLNLS